MTPSELNLVRATFEPIRSMPDRFVAALLQRIAALDPAVATLLPASSGEGAARSIEMIGTVLAGLDAAGSNKATDQAFALHHRWAAVQPRYYGVVGQAFLDALATCLGPAFTDAARAAWAQGFVMLAESVMARSYNPLGLAA